VHDGCPNLCAYDDFPTPVIGINFKSYRLLGYRFKKCTHCRYLTVTTFDHCICCNQCFRTRKTPNNKRKYPEKLCIMNKYGYPVEICLIPNKFEDKKRLLMFNYNRILEANR
jgi:hypothetical protein